MTTMITQAVKGVQSLRSKLYHSNRNLYQLNQSAQKCLLAYPCLTADGKRAFLVSGDNLQKVLQASIISPSFSVFRHRSSGSVLSLPCFDTCTQIILLMWHLDIWQLYWSGPRKGLSIPTEHPQNSRSYFVSSKILLSYHYVHLMVLMYSSMGISSINP